MNDNKSFGADANEPDSLMTERDIDDKFGLFQEDTFPDALADEDQKEAINHALPTEYKEMNTMAEGYNKTEADLAYERYNQLGSVTSNEDIPVNDLRESTPETKVGLDGVIDEEIDPVLVNDGHLAADIGLNRTHPTDRDEILESDAVWIASAAGLTEGEIDYADEEDLADDDTMIDTYEDELPLEDVPDADDIEENTPVDPAAPPLEIVHGTDLLNGSNGE